MFYSVLILTQNGRLSRIVDCTTWQEACNIARQAERTGQQTTIQPINNRSFNLRQKGRNQSC